MSDGMLVRCEWNRRIEDVVIRVCPRSEATGLAWWVLGFMSLFMPRVLERTVQVFPVKGVCVGVVYTRDGELPSRTVLRHEAVHVLQAVRDGLWTWRLRYVLSARWRAVYECEAYRVQIDEKVLTPRQVAAILRESYLLDDGDFPEWFRKEIEP